MSSQDPQRGNEEARRGQIMGGEVSRMPEHMEPELQVHSLGTWTASFHCEWCRGLMYRIQLRDWGEAEDRMVVMPCNVLPVGTSSTR